MWNFEKQEWQIEKRDQGDFMANFSVGCRHFLMEPQDLKSFTELSKTFPKQRKIREGVLDCLRRYLWQGVCANQWGHDFYALKYKKMWVCQDLLKRIGHDLRIAEQIQHYLIKIIDDLNHYLDVKTKRPNEQEVNRIIEVLATFKGHAGRYEVGVCNLLDEMEVIEVVKKGEKPMAYLIQSKAIRNEQRGEEAWL